MKRKISQSEIYQDFDLEDLLGYSPSNKQKSLFTSLAIDKIIDRTVEGKDINSKKFIPYNQEYADRKGVIASSVDLVLSGDMLNSIESDNSKVRIEVDSSQTDKAYGHISGMKGHPTIKKGKKRDFFGFKSKKDIEGILNEVDSVKQVPSNLVKEETGFNIIELRKIMTSSFFRNTEFNNGDS